MALACALPEPVAFIAALHDHRCLSPPLPTRCSFRARSIGLLFEQGFEQAPQLAVTSRLASLAQVVGNIQLSCAALSNVGAAHVDVCPSMLDVEALAVGVEDEMPLVLVVQDGPSGGPVQLSFQQSHAHLLLRAAKARIIAQGLSECGIMAGPSERGNHLLSLRQIAAGLNGRGIPVARGRAWTAVQVKRVFEGS